ncbi:hypothetical protein BUALT_Bualt11G0028800 [Buddleja alternifolia]|uniref:Uncharacterized protein n=1 Tax=Buddleja alternifolia TaxID=168488 RepID=A0AAV6WYF0_9LAMI|nr:hypothetical protein BUALT_Bualt11G0028800 [Buddleja alternifolia]
MAQSKINFENGAQESVWSQEHERVPLKQRLKMLLASHPIAVDFDVKSESEPPVLPPNVGEAVAEIWDNEDNSLRSDCSAEEQMIETILKEERHAGELGEFSNQENLANKCMNTSHTITAAATSEKVDPVHSNSLRGSCSTVYPVTVKVECADIGVESPSANCINVSSLAGIQAANFESEMGDQFLDELDHVVLKERLRRLLTRFLFLSNLTIPHLVSKCLGLTSMLPELGFCHLELSSKPYNGTSHLYKNGGKPLLSGNIKNVEGSVIPSLANIKIEPPNCNVYQSSNLNTEGQMSFMNLVLVKSEVEVSGDLNEDELDHMLLRKRMKLLSPKNDPNSNNLNGSKCMSKIIRTSLDYKPVASEPSVPIKINRPRKRRRTVTDSVETAMEEDAPGLLQVLMKKGVSVNEIKLYGEPESNDALDDSSTNDNFSELETVIGKLFSRRETFLKFGPIQCTKGERASYCLECLFSLVEQARYLHFRNWPVEWGWCRDLQSFIFVFERHNRIVLERPEYGYATYFFELADSLPIDWQIKRLVTAMKLTSCSRVTLIENKALMVGDDLTEGEARVLMEYGWLPNTGLGTMLNYYDRVVHDRRNEKDSSSEWRSKIGKLLMDGYNGGTIVSAGIPRKVTEYNIEHPVQIKLELN